MILIYFVFSQYGNIKGFITDASNGEKLPYANIVLEGTNIGTASDNKGYYYLPNIAPGKYRLIVSYIGYEEKIEEINIVEGKTITINVELKPKEIELSGITITSKREVFEKTINISQKRITQAEIKSVPTFFENDLLKAIEILPGITSMHELSNKLFVRGGSPDENLVLLDGIIIYNPSTHLFGLFSTFQPDAVSEAEIHLGGFPAKYGDRLSSVLEVTTKEGNSKRFQFQGSIGLITSKILFEGPIPKGSFLISGRRTYFDALAWLYTTYKGVKISFPYYFYDLISKVNFVPSLDNRFTLTIFGGVDVLNFDAEDDVSNMKVNINWGNRGASLRWRRVITEKLYGDIVSVYSNFFTHFNAKDLSNPGNDIHLFEEIKSFNLNSNFSYIFDEKHLFDFGLQCEVPKINQEWGVSVGTFKTPSQSSKSFSLYLQDKWFLIKPVFFIQPGIRFIYYIPPFKNIGRLYFNPRFGLKYRLTENSTFNIALGKYNQFITTITSQESYFSLFDLWRPVDSLHPAPVSYHFIIGIEKWIDETSLFNIEGYFKKYYNFILPKTDYMFFSVPSESLTNGNGYSTGFDIFFKKELGNHVFWLSYTFGWTRRVIDTLSYFPRYDRRHTLNIIYGYKIPSFISFFGNAKIDFRFYLGSGLPYSEEIGRYKFFYDINQNEEEYELWFYIKGPRDCSRLPVSHRLDMHIEKDIKIFSLKGGWYLDIMNVYSRKNILFYSYEYIDPYTGETLDPPRKIGYSILPIMIPSFGINVRF